MIVFRREYDTLFLLCLSSMASVKVKYTTITGDVKEILMDDTLPLLDQLQAGGIDQPSSCMSGACGTCRTKIVSGRDQLDEEAFGAKLYPVEEDEILTCVCGVQKGAEGGVVELESVED